MQYFLSPFSHTKLECLAPPFRNLTSHDFWKCTWQLSAHSYNQISTKRQRLAKLGSQTKSDKLPATQSQRSPTVPHCAIFQKGFIWLSRDTKSLPVVQTVVVQFRSRIFLLMSGQFSLALYSYPASHLGCHNHKRRKLDYRRESDQYICPWGFLWRLGYWHVRSLDISLSIFDDLQNRQGGFLRSKSSVRQSILP